MSAEMFSFKSKKLDVKISRPTVLFFTCDKQACGAVRFAHSGLESEGSGPGRLYLSGYYGMSVSQTGQLER